MSRSDLPPNAAVPVSFTPNIFVNSAVESEAIYGGGWSHFVVVSFALSLFNVIWNQTNALNNMWNFRGAVVQLITFGPPLRVMKHLFFNKIVFR